MSSEELEKSNDDTNQQNQHLKNRMIENLTLSGNVTKSAKASGIDRTTYYLWCRQDATFKEEASQALELARESRIDKLEDAIMDQAIGNEAKGIKPNVIAQIFSLKALSRQSSQRQWSDAPPPEVKAPEDKDPASLTDTNQDKLKQLMEEFIQELPPATPAKDTSKPSD